MSNEIETQDELLERVAKAITSIWNKPSPNPTAFPASAEMLARAALQAAAVEPEPGLDEAIAELRSLVFGKRKKVFALLEMNERHALQGEHRVLWPDAILGLDAKAIADAVRQVKGTEEGSA